MSLQNINLGTAPSGAGGDTPRSAFTKAQANFEELYSWLFGGAETQPSLPVARGGTGGTTPATAREGLGFTTVGNALATAASQAAGRTALGLKLAAIADILGTVSQAAGVPTGAILERGSTANGDYIKLADGTMVCWRRVLGPVYATAQYLQIEWQYPMQFIAAPVVFAGGIAGIDQLKYNRGAIGVTGSASSATVRVFATGTDTFVSGDGSSAQAIAVGRWF
ncbi:TPA: hypothetical protein ACKP22_002415 [Pseudomonas putida]